MKTLFSTVFPRKDMVASKNDPRRHVGRTRLTQSSRSLNKQPPKELFAELPHLVWMTDASGRCIYVNDTFAAFTGASPESFMENSWTKFLHPHDVEETTASWLSSVLHHTIHQAQYRIKRHDNVYRWMLARAVPVKGENGQVSHWIGTNTDIHDLREKWQGLQNSDVSEHELMTTWAHDFRLPLTIARLKAELTFLHRDGPQYVAKNIDTIMREVDRIDTMIKDLFSNKPSQKHINVPVIPHLTDLREILSTSVRRLSSIYPERLIVSIAEQNMTGIWNATALQRALENLVENAVKYGHSDTPVSVSLVSTSNQVIISVHNRGPALTSETLRSIFTPHLRTSQPDKPDQVGWGLGLPLVKRIAEAHGGFVGVESSESEGTTFRVVLPLVEPY